MKTKPQEIWAEYNTGIEYLTSTDIYESVELNQSFVNGDQWHGVSAPDIVKPVVNILRPAVDWFTSMLVSDDIAISCDLSTYETKQDIPNGLDEEQAKKLNDLTKQSVENVVTKSINDVFEYTKYKPKLRIFTRNAAIDGGSYKHWWYNTKKIIDPKYKGCIDMEIIDNTNVIFGNPAEHDVHKQPYIIIIAKLPTDTVKDMVAKNLQDGIISNDDDNTNLERDSRAVSKYTTVLTKFWKEDNIVHFTKTTENVVINPPKSLNIKAYPISKMDWKKLKNAYQGVSPLTEVIPNQIMINQFFMMMNEFNKKMAFPKLLFNTTLIKEWSNKVEALGVDGDPREAVTSSTPNVQMNEQTFKFVDNLIAQTKQTLGIQDVSLGSVAADNTSAIIALQKTAAQPLELQRLDLFTSIEDDVRIIVELMATSYGKRPVYFVNEEGEGTMEFDFSELSYEAFKMNVEVGQSYYWSQVTAIQTLDNMYSKGIIPDAITYLEQLPNGTVRNRDDIIKAIRKLQTEQQEAQQAQMMAQQQPQMPQQQIQIPQPDIA